MRLSFLKLYHRASSLPTEALRKTKIQSLNTCQQKGLVLGILPRLMYMYVSTESAFVFYSNYVARTHQYYRDTLLGDYNQSLFASYCCSEVVCLCFTSYFDGKPSSWFIILWGSTSKVMTDSQALEVVNIKGYNGLSFVHDFSSS